MADPISIPSLEFPGMVDPRSGALSQPLYDFLRALAEAVGVSVDSTTLTALAERVAALEGASGDLRIFGTNGITVYGDEASGFQIDLDGGASAAAGSFVPTFVAEDETFTVPAFRQALFALPIDVEGTLDLEGDLVAV